MTVGMILQPFLEERFVNGNVISRFREQKVRNTGYHMALRKYEISFEEKISTSKRPCNVLFTIAGFHTVRAWVRVCVLWDYQHKTPIFRKSTPRFTKSSSFVLIGPILNKVQPFKILKNY